MFDMEMHLRSIEVQEHIGRIDNRTLKTMAVDYMNGLGLGRVFRRSDLTMADCRGLIFEAAMFHGYQL